MPSIFGEKSVKAAAEAFRNAPDDAQNPWAHALAAAEAALDREGLVCRAVDASRDAGYQIGVVGQATAIVAALFPTEGGADHG